jgi:hypothetical protein
MATPAISWVRSTPVVHHDTLFSNAGPVGADLDIGASEVSTIRVRDRLQALATVPTTAYVREVEDPDDIRGGFAVWSGTSFAAPLVAGASLCEVASGLCATTRTRAAIGALGDVTGRARKLRGPRPSTAQESDRRDTVMP